MGRPSTNTTGVCERCGTTFGYRPSARRMFCSQDCYIANKSVNNDDDFWKKVDRNGPIPTHRHDLGQCWIWTGANDGSFGYGTFNRNRVRYAAHRYALQLKIKRLLTESELACHHCDNPICVRPEHLFVGTHLVNINDAIQKRRRPLGEKHHRSKLTVSQIEKMRELFASHNESLRSIAASFNVSIKHVWRIVTHRAWKHVS